MVNKVKTFRIVCIAVLYFCCAFSMTAAPKSKVDWSPAVAILEEKAICVTFDYSEAILDDEMTIEEKAADDEDWEKDSKEAEWRFCRELRSLVGRRVEFVSPDENAMTIVIRPGKIDGKGKFRGTVQILDKDGTTLVEDKNIQVKGGAFGSFTNLMGDGYENLASLIMQCLLNTGKRK